MQEVLMTPDLCMRFLIWSYYYHDIIPEQGKSYSVSGKFAETDVERLAASMPALSSMPSTISRRQRYVRSRVRFRRENSMQCSRRQ